MIFARDHLDFGIATEFFQRADKLFDRAFEVEGIKLTGGDMKLACQARFELWPAAFDEHVDIIILPALYDDRIDLPACSIPHPQRFTIVTQRAKNRLERSQLSAPSQAIVHLAEGVIPEHRKSTGSGDVLQTPPKVSG